MIEQKIPLNTIAKEQGFKESTIIGHVEKLLASDKKLNYEYLRPSQEVSDAIAHAFTQFEDSKLKPVYEFLDEQYSYDQIRLVKFFIDQEGVK